MLTYIFLILGFIFLIKGADLLVDGASAIGKRFGLSSLVIGLTIVAFGTSAPELILNIIASINGAGDIAIGNIVGSNISNILLIGGIAALIFPIRVQSGTVWKEIPFSLLAILVLFFFLNDAKIDQMGISVLSRIDGLVLISFFLIFMYYTFGIAKVKESDDTEYETLDLRASLVYILIGGVGLFIGGQWVVNNAIVIASSLGMSESLMGLTILAIGTSLPELATAIVASMKQKSKLAIGNIVGSNIFNIFFVLGISATIRPIVFNEALNTDIFIGIIATLLLYYFALSGKKSNTVSKMEGAVLVGAYVAYLVFLVWRG